MSILKVEELSHLYGRNTPFEHLALDKVSFEIEKGEFVGIIGHTGSGKSTLIQHMNGLLKPDSGKIYFHDKDIWQKGEIRSVRFKIGLVFQYPEYQLFEETIFKDIAFGPKNMGLSESEVESRVREAADFVGISQDMLDKSPFELSGGQKRRVAIAGIIAMRPEVLILDEPTAGLDPRGCREILERIEDYHKRVGSAVLLVTHNMEDIARFADRLIVLDNSTIFCDGKLNEVFKRSDELVRIGLDVPQITKVMLRLKELGMDIDISTFTVEQAKEKLLPMLKGK